MATSSLLGIDADNLPLAHSATGIDSLGPSDASDSGSDSAGAYSTESDSDTDRFGTGERGSVEPDPQPSARDILPDHVENMQAGGPGGGAGPDEGMQDDDRDAVDTEREIPGRGNRRADAPPLSADDLPGSSGADEEPQDSEGAGVP
jgi:hypothetical protein